MEAVSNDTFETHYLDSAGIEVNEGEGIMSHLLQSNLETFTSGLDLSETERMLRVMELERAAQQREARRQFMMYTGVSGLKSFDEAIKEYAWELQATGAYNDAPTFIMPGTFNAKTGEDALIIEKLNEITTLKAAKC